MSPRDFAALDGCGQMLLAHHAIWHLNIEACNDRGTSIADTQNPIADDKPFEAPLVAEHIVEQLMALSAPFAVDAVVRRHHRSNAFVDHPTEVRQVNLVQRHIVDQNINGEPSVLH